MTGNVYFLLMFYGEDIIKVANIDNILICILSSMYLHCTFNITTFYTREKQICFVKPSLPFSLL